VDSEQGIEEIGEADAVGFGCETEEGAIGVKAPGQAIGGDFEGGFSVAVEEFATEVATGVFVGEFDTVRAMPLYVDDGDEAVGQESFDQGAVL